MGRRSSRTSRKPQVFKPQPKPTTMPKTAPPATQTSNPNSMGSTVMTGMGLGLGAAAGNAAFSTLAGAISGQQNESQPPQETINPNQNMCDLVKTKFNECLQRDFNVESCHELHSLLMKMNCHEN